MVKYQQYDDFKESFLVWMGNVPKHWKINKFKWMFKEKTKTLNPSLPAGSISFGNVIYKNEKNLSPDTKASYQEVLNGEYLINPLNLNFDLKSLRTALSQIDVVVSTGYIVLIDNGKFNKQYLRWLLYEFDVAHMKKLGSGVRQTINYTDIANSLFFHPELKEQAQIANFLDHETAQIDTLIEKQQTLIQLLKEKRQAVISHAVTKGLNPDAPMKDSGVEWLGEVPEHWSITRIKYVAELTPSKSGILSRLEERCSFIPMEKLKLDTLVLDETRQIKDVYQGYTYFEDGDVLIAKVTPCFENQNMAIAANLVNGIGFGSSEIYVLRAEAEVLNQFLLYRLQESVFMQLGAGAMTGAGGLRRVPSDFLNNFQFGLPPISEQQEIVEHIEKMKSKFNDLIDNAEQAIQLMQERRTALISAAVTGKIDVRGWRAPE